MSGLSFNTNIFLFGGSGIIITIAAYFIGSYVLKNISEDDLGGNDKRSIKKWYKIISICAWALFFIVMIMFHGIRWTPTNTYDMGSDITLEKSMEYKGPTRDEILEANKIGVNRVMKEKEEERKAANAASSEEYEQFLNDSEPVHK